jgi:hypothetical protein
VGRGNRNRQIRPSEWYKLTHMKGKGKRTIEQEES